MKTSFPISVLSVATAIALFGSVAYGAEPDAKQAVAQADTNKSATTTTTKTTPFSYQAPLRGAPATRVGGGTRSVQAHIPTLNVLAPNETGYTLQEKPTIYWYLSETVASPVELTISSTEPLRDAASPTLEITLKPPVSKGVHAFRLEDHGIVLKPGVEYQWFVAVVPNPAQRSNDVIAGGSIKRVADADAVQAKLKQTSQALWPAVFAEGGIWYDAIDQLSKQISADPNNRQLREQRAKLLEQVGLHEAAAFDRGS